MGIPFKRIEKYCFLCGIDVYFIDKKFVLRYNADVRKVSYEPINLIVLIAFSFSCLLSFVLHIILLFQFENRFAVLVFFYLIRTPFIAQYAKQCTNIYNLTVHFDY